jgi:hypothetical protein
MVEEANDQRRIEVLNAQGRWSLFQPPSPAAEGQQEAKGVSIIRDGMRTGVALAHEPLGKERLQQFR